MKCYNCWNFRPSLQGLGYICCAKQDTKKYYRDGAERCKCFDADLEFNRIGTPRTPRPTKDERKAALLNALEEVQ